MNTLRLDAIRDCFEGVVPCVMATSDPDGVPNASMVSQIHYVDPFRIALSYQFFNKTRRNVLATRTASIVVFDPFRWRSTGCSLITRKPRPAARFLKA